MSPLGGFILFLIIGGIIGFIIWYILTLKKLKIGDTVQWQYQTGLKAFQGASDDEPPYNMTAQGQICDIQLNKAKIQWNGIWNQKYPQHIWWRSHNNEQWGDEYLGGLCVDKNVKEPTVNVELKTELPITAIKKPATPVVEPKSKSN